MSEPDSAAPDTIKGRAPVRVQESYGVRANEGSAVPASAIRAQMREAAIKALEGEGLVLVRREYLEALEAVGRASIAYVRGVQTRGARHLVPDPEHDLWLDAVEDLEALKP